MGQAVVGEAIGVPSAACAIETFPSAHSITLRADCVRFFQRGCESATPFLIRSRPCRQHDGVVTPPANVGDRIEA